MLPKSIAQRLKKALAKHDGGENEQLLIADSYPEVSILFADIVRFSEWSTKIDAERLVKILNILVSAWDSIALTFEVEKIKVGIIILSLLLFYRPSETAICAFVVALSRILSTLLYLCDLL